MNTLPIVLLTCSFAIIFSKDRLHATLYCVLIFIIASIVGYNLSGPTHAHNPLGQMSGNVLMIVVGGPIVLLALCFKKQKKQ